MFCFKLFFAKINILQPQQKNIITILSSYKNVSNSAQRKEKIQRHLPDTTFPSFLTNFFKSETQARAWAAKFCFNIHILQSYYYLHHTSIYINEYSFPNSAGMILERTQWTFFSFLVSICFKVESSEIVQCFCLHNQQFYSS